MWRIDLLTNISKTEETIEKLEDLKAINRSNDEGSKAPRGFRIKLVIKWKTFDTSKRFNSTSMKVKIWRSLKHILRKSSLTTNSKCFKKNSKDFEYYPSLLQSFENFERSLIVTPKLLAHLRSINTDA